MRTFQSALVLALVGLVLALLGAPAPACAQTISDLTGLTGLLQPGSRPALAIGGDPFCSPVEDQDGWWQRMGLSRPPEVMVEGAWSEPVQSDVANDRRTISGRWVVDPPFARGRVRVAGEIMAPDWRAGWTGSDGSVRLEGSGVGGTFGARAFDLIPGLTIQGVSPTVGDLKGVRSPAAGAGARYRVGSLAVLQGAWEASRAPEMLRSDLYNEPIAASLNLRSERSRLDAVVRLPWRFRLEGSVARSDFRGLEAREVAPVYHLSPLGNSRLAQGSIAWQSPVRWRFLGRYTRRDLETHGTGSWGGQKFAELTAGIAEQESYLLGAEYWSSHGARWLVDVETVRANARARLELETWPFTAATVDLLGMRRIYRARGEATWHRAHMAHARPVGRTAHVSVGLSGYDIMPKGSLESWRPAFLVFGMADRHYDPLETRRLQLAAISLGFGVAAGATRFDLAAQQFVFAKAFQSGSDAPSEGGVAEPPIVEAPSDDSRPGWSGVEIRASVSRSFGPATKR